MSLISVNNFMAPFTNKGNLIFIALVAFVFGIGRYAGGGFSMTSSDSPRSRSGISDKARSNLILDEDEDEEIDLPVAKKTSPTRKETTESLDELMRKADGSAAANKPKPSAERRVVTGRSQSQEDFMKSVIESDEIKPKPQAEENPLDDIERKLGLR